MREAIEVRTGKGSQLTAQRVAALLRRHGYDVLTMHEPLQVEGAEGFSHAGGCGDSGVVGPELVHMRLGFTDEFADEEEQPAHAQARRLRFPSDWRQAAGTSRQHHSAVNLQVILRASDHSLALCLRLVELLAGLENDGEEAGDAEAANQQLEDEQEDELLISTRYQHVEQMTNHLLRLRDSLSAIEGLLSELNLLHHELDQDMLRPRGA